MKATRLLHDEGQSLWLDNITRELLDSGTLKQYIDDLSVTGFDDLDLARATTPKLTTVRQPVEEMGRMAVSLMIRILERHQLDALHVELATELVIRGSTGVPR